MANGLLSSQNLDAFVQGVNTALAAIGTSDSAIYSKVCFVDDGSATNGNILGKVQGTVDNGPGTPGEIVRYGFSPVANPPETWHFGTDRAEVDAQVQYVEIARKRIAPKSERFYFDIQDVYGLMEGKVPAIMQRAGMCWDWELAAAINGNATCYDGLPFFSDQHPCNPSDDSLGEYSNDISVAALDATGFAQALDAFGAIKWFDGKVRSNELRKPIVLCPNKSLELKARQLVFGSLIPTAGGSNDVAASSPFNGMVEDVLYFPALLSENAGNNAAKYIYLVSPGTPVKAGFIASPKRQPQFFITGTDPAQESRVKKGALVMGWDAYGAVGLGLPQDVVRVKVG